jgi:G3E family GTPase
MSNGCICCTLREDLLVEVKKLAEQGRFDYLLIESTGISEPMPVAETFTFTDEDGTSLGDVAELDTMVTVVDAAAFPRDLGGATELRERGLGLGEDDDRTVDDLLVEQVEFADVIVINKTDLVSAAELPPLQAVLRKLNPGAEQVLAQEGRVSSTRCWRPAASTSTARRESRVDEANCAGRRAAKRTPTASAASSTGRGARSIPRASTRCCAATGRA